jgi:hypothetical protein
MEIISATYGPMDVTEKMRKFFTTSVTASTKSRSFVITNTFFGGDPLYNSVKAFIMVWRTSARDADAASKSRYALRTTRALENELVTINYTEPLQQTNPPDRFPHLISASYHNVDVTSIVATYLAERPTNGICVSTEVFGIDPAFGSAKTLSATYAYVQPGGVLEYHVKVVRDGQSMAIPPHLYIHSANWGGLDITNTIRAQIASDQRLQINTNYMLEAPDPWYGVSKSIAIIYQYGNNPLDLLISHDGAGIVSISPNGPLRRLHVASAELKNPKHLFSERTILAIVWGTSLVSLHQLPAEAATQLSKMGTLVCNNETFGLDGRFGHQKTCQVFWKSGKCGPIQCSSAREGETLFIP